MFYNPYFSRYRHALERSFPSQKSVKVDLENKSTCLKESNPEETVQGLPGAAEEELHNIPEDITEDPIDNIQEDAAEEPAVNLQEDIAEAPAGNIPEDAAEMPAVNTQEDAAEMPLVKIYFSGFKEMAPGIYQFQQTAPGGKEVELPAKLLPPLCSEHNNPQNAGELGFKRVDGLPGPFQHYKTPVFQFT